MLANGCAWLRSRAGKSARLCSSRSDAAAGRGLRKKTHSKGADNENDTTRARLWLRRIADGGHRLVHPGASRFPVEHVLRHHIRTIAGDRAMSTSTAQQEIAKQKTQKPSDTRCLPHDGAAPQRVGPRRGSLALARGSDPALASSAPLPRHPACGDGEGKGESPWQRLGSPTPRVTTTTRR